jgi:hypothetical protein
MAPTAISPARIGLQRGRGLVRRGLGTDVEPAFAATCHQLTGGVPFLVEELVRAIAERGIEPTAAASTRVAALAPRAVSH